MADNFTDKVFMFMQQILNTAELIIFILYGIYCARVWFALGRFFVNHNIWLESSGVCCLQHNAGQLNVLSIHIKTCFLFSTTRVPDY